MLIGDIDTYLVAERDSTTTARVPISPRHSHGYLPSHPKMFTSLVLSGKGIRRGARIGHARSIDVAPTIAALLGVELPDVDGSVLTQALEP